jgi:hypothetical protein
MKLVDFFKNEFAPDLRQKSYELVIVDAAGTAKVEPGRYSGIPFDTLEIKTTHGENISLDIYLSWKRTIQKLGLFVRGKLVIEDIAAHPNFNHEPWTSGHTSGEIRCDFLRPITGRSGGVAQGAEWSRFVTAVTSLEDKISEKISEVLAEQHSRQARRIFKELNQALATVWKRLAWDQLPRTWAGAGSKGTALETGGGGIGAGAGGGTRGNVGPPRGTLPWVPRKPREIARIAPGQNERRRHRPSTGVRQSSSRMQCTYEAGI